MRLVSLQRRMARAVMAPLTASDHMRTMAPDGRPMRVVAADFIKPNDRLTSFERLEIYNRQYWWRVLASLGEDFPGLRAVLRERKFEAMCKAYLTDCPSRSFTLRNLGSRLEAWLRKHPKWAGGRQALAIEMVRLEWADIEAFDGKQEPPVHADDLRGAVATKLRLALQPHITLLELRYPVDELLLEVKRSGEKDFASNAFREHHKKKRVLAVAQLKPAKIFLAVHRADHSVYFRRLEREEFLMLSALRDGKPLGRAIESAFRQSRIPAAEQAAKVEHWFQHAAALGWFCRPDRPIQKIAQKTKKS
jgi:hypothetical protein